MANTIFYSKTVLTGGSAVALDSIDGSLLVDGDFAHVTVAGALYIYKLNGSSSAAESSPSIIAPDTNPGTKRWELQSYYGIKFPQGHLAGLGLSNASDTEHDITIAVGTARDSSNAYDLTLASAMTKRIDAAWAAGSAAGGMFTGSVGNATWYHVFLIRKDADVSIDAGFDTSVTAANIPAGYTAYRRVGSVLTNGSANIVQFVQDGDHFEWAEIVSDVNTSNPGTSAVTPTMSVPLGISVVVNLIATGTAGGANNVSILVTSPGTTDQSGGYPNTSLWLPVNDTNGNELWIRSNTSSQIRYRCSASEAGFSVRLLTKGWLDTRGRN